jgi:hypothetical protein
MKYLLALLTILLPLPVQAGLLFGTSSRTVIHNYGAPISGYSMTYGRSYSVGPTYRTYRLYRSPVVTYSAPAVGYYVPPPAPVAAPQAAPADAPDPAPVVQYRTYAAPAYSTYSVDVDPAVAKVKHKESHRHGKHKVSHKESSRD